MNILRLNGTSFLPDALVENYQSMIWTERFFSNGEFELKTSDIQNTRALLPEGALISEQTSTEVMIVENHEIDRDDDGIPSLTVTGRTFDTFLENRALTSTEYNVPWSTKQQYRTADVAAMLMWNELVNTTGQDASRDGIDAAHSVLTAVDGLVITDSSTINDPPQYWWFNQGTAYDMLRSLLSLGIVGVRTIRPSHSDGNVYLFDTGSGGPETRGTFFYMPSWDIPEMRLDVYNGTDRTMEQDLVDKVIFHYQSGHIDDPKYLFSGRDLRNVAAVQSSIGTSVIGPGLALSGLARRVLFVDAGDIGDQIYADYVASINQKGLIALAQHNQNVIFDGAISLHSPYSYGVDYFLGDTITLLAEYGVEESMFVSEYIRTEDSEGDRGYPTLTLSN